MAGSFSRIQYFLKRYGLPGFINHKLRHKLFPKDTDKINSYLFLQHHYYEKLKESDYLKELGEWYSTYHNGNFENILQPKTFNEKIQWLKIYDNTELRAICADKFRVRNYINKLNLPDLHLIPLLGVWDSAESIDFNSLPDSFVLKQNAACKLNLIIKNKASMDEDKVRALMKTWLEITFGYNGMELQYIKSPKKIVAEKYIHELDGDLTDYKIFCFNGEPKFVEVIGDRGIDLKHGKAEFLDLDWKILDFRTITYPKYSISPAKPENLDKMITIAKALSEPFKFVRVDLYNVAGKIYFGEMTFTPTNGAAKWSPSGTDERLGQLIDLR